VSRDLRTINPEVAVKPEKRERIPDIQGCPKAVCQRDSDSGPDEKIRPGFGAELFLKSWKMIR